MFFICSDLVDLKLMTGHGRDPAVPTPREQHGAVSPAPVWLLWAVQSSAWGVLPGPLVDLAANQQHALGLESPPIPAGSLWASAPPLHTPCTPDVSRLF